MSGIVITKYGSKVSVHRDGTYITPACNARDPRDGSACSLDKGHTSVLHFMGARRGRAEGPAAMTTEPRWYAAKRDNRVLPTPYLRVTGQPEEGFPHVKAVMDWLKAEGLLGKGKRDDEGIVRYPRWGDPFCCVEGSRDDPWEPAPREPGERYCCFIDRNDDECRQLADYEIRDTADRRPDSYTHACPAHLELMLGGETDRPSATQWVVTDLTGAVAP